MGRTAAALLALVLLGHTRRTGSRRRTVLKAANWLKAHESDALAALALQLLANAEALFNLLHAYGVNEDQQNKDND